MDASRRTRGAVLLLAPILVVAVIAAVIAFSSRGDAAFVFDQQHSRVVDPRELEALVKKAPEPTPAGPGSSARDARCTPGSRAGERNPWSCVVRYASGTTRRYRVTVRPNGSYRGADRTGQFLVDGCCVSTPAEG